MRIERLFNVLVLGGVAAAAGCGSEESDRAHSPSNDAGTGGTGGEIDADSGSDAGGASGGAAGAAGGASGGAAGAAGGASGGAAGAAGGHGNLECSEAAQPSDACGCPCCWISDCLNSEPCCSGFCADGDHGKGCCGA